MTTPDSQELSRLSQTVLISHHRNLPDNAREAFREIQERWEWHGIAHAVFTWMEMAKHSAGLTPENFGEDALFIPFALTPDGHLRDMNTLKDVRAIGIQMFTTFLSGQHHTSMALFVTAANKNLGSELVTFMLTVCLALSRNFLDTADIETTQPPKDHS